MMWEGRQGQSDVRFVPQVLSPTVWGSLAVFAEDRGEARPDETVAPVMWVRIGPVVASKWTCALLSHLGSASLFPVRDG